jgi:glycine/D-amino acid oxidase-like deaminating enzyme
MKKAAVIGAGVFGICAALELSNRGFGVVLVDRHEEILAEASTINHLRHHYGYHYPRSPETVREIQRCTPAFMSEYGACVDRNMVSFYALAKKGSKVTPEQYYQFCREMSLLYEERFPAEDIIDRTRVSLCMQTPEPVYSPRKLSDMMMRNLGKSNVDVRLGVGLVGGDVSGRRKRLIFCFRGKQFPETVDLVVNATYAGINEVNRMLGIKTKTFQYELMEMLELEIPSDQRFGLTVIDGGYSSIMPRDTGTYALADVRFSVLKRVVADRMVPEVSVLDGCEKTPSNRKAMMRRAIQWYPFLRDAKVWRSFNVTKIVKANVDRTDERLTEIDSPHRGVYSIFGGKVLTCVEFARRVVDRIEKET